MLLPLSGMEASFISADRALYLLVKSFEVFSSGFTKVDLSALKKIASNTDIIDIIVQLPCSPFTIR